MCNGGGSKKASVRSTHLTHYLWELYLLYSTSFKQKYVGNWLKYSFLIKRIKIEGNDFHTPLLASHTPLVRGWKKGSYEKLRVDCENHFPIFICICGIFFRNQVLILYDLPSPYVHIQCQCLSYINHDYFSRVNMVTNSPYNSEITNKSF